MECFLKEGIQGMIIRAWKKRKMIKKQKNRLHSVRDQLTLIVSAWNPRFVIDEESARLSNEMKTAIEESIRRLDHIYVSSHAATVEKIGLLYDEIDTQIENLKQNLQRYAGCSYAQDSVQKIEATIRALIHVTTK